MNMQKSGMEPTTISNEASNPNSPMFLDYLRDDEQEEDVQDDSRQQKIESNSHIPIANLPQQTQSNSSERTFTNDTSNSNAISTNGNSNFRSSMNNSLTNLLTNSSLSSSQISHIQKTYLSQFSNPGVYSSNQSDSFSLDESQNQKASKNNTTNFKKRRIDYAALFMDIRQGKHGDDVEWIDVEGYPRNSIFRFTDIGLQKHREGLQKLCRDNYKKMKQYNIVPFDDDTAKQKVGYNR